MFIFNEEVINDFEEYIEYISQNTPNLLKKENPTKEEIVLQNLLCIQEELGELVAGVRKLTKFSFSQKKIDSFSFNDLEDEACDVLITLFLLFKSLGIKNLDEAMRRKILKNNDRGY